MVETFRPKQSARGKKSKYETHMYYRRPSSGEDPDWIVVGGVKGGKRERYEDLKGFTPLKEFEEIPNGHSNPWEYILTQPNGPKAFPADQVLKFRWHNPEDLPTECYWVDKDENPCPYMEKLKAEGVHFPQLAGHTVTDHSCPECDNRAPFSTIDGVGGVGDLAKHLSIMHNWDVDRMKKYGAAVGIDFDAAYSKIVKSKTWEFGAAGDFSCTACEWKPDPEKEASPQKQYAGHKLGAHKEPVTA